MHYKIVSNQNSGDATTIETPGNFRPLLPALASEISGGGSVALQAAITGAACRLPGAQSLDELWQLIASGRDSLSTSTEQRYEALRLTPRYIEAIKEIGHDRGGFIDGVNAFDPTVFGMNYRDACAADPQQRLLLEVAWEALENACEAPDRLAGSRTGVFVGISSFDYAMFQAAFDPYGEHVNPYSSPGAAHSIAANRISYALDLHGPSIAIDTACSSSFYALHMALKSMQSGECDSALVCGVQLILSPYITKAFKRARMISPAGLCKTFDQSADGYVRAEGAVAIYLKPLATATAEGARVMGVITGSAINHDGKTSGIVAPNGALQVEVIRAAQAAACVGPDKIRYVEAHGTGTHLGDSTELTALSKVFPGSRDEPCYVGSVKSNVGHLEPVSGLAGLIKTLMCFEHETIPAQAHLKTPIKAAHIDGARIIVPMESVAWPRGGEPRIAGVSSFGFGGANAHIIMTEPPLPVAAGETRDRPRHLLKITAKQADRLPLAACNLLETLKANPGYALPDICHSANIGRADFPERVLISATNRAELLTALEAVASGEKASNVVAGTGRDAGRSVALMFSGQGAQYAGMARGLMESEPVFRDSMRESDAVLRRAAGFSLIDLLYAPATPAALVDDTRYTQPALFAVELGLARLLQSWGVEPAFVIGHSIGEYVAAVLDGILDAEDALELVAARGALMSALSEPGAMMFVAATPDTVSALLATVASDRVVIAAVNGPEAVVVSGALQAIAAFETAAKAKRIACKRLDVSHAFHSPLMEPMLAAFHERAAKIRFRPATRRFVSTSLGRPLNPASNEAIDADYWTQQIRNSVRFWDGLETAIAQGADVLIEVGPHPTLLPFIASVTRERDIVLASCLKRGKDDHAELFANIGRVYTAGVRLDWRGFDAPFARKRLVLPSYPFARKTFWFNIDAPLPTIGVPRTAAPAPGNGAVAPVADGTPPAAAINDALSAVHPVAGSDRLAALARDHVIRGSALFPATGYLALMLETHKDALEDGIELLDVKFLSAQAIEDHGLPALTVVTTRENDDRWLAMVCADGNPGQPRRALARGNLRRLGGHLKAATFTQPTDEPPFELSPEDFYTQLDAAGLSYGPSFRRIRDLKVYANRARAEIVCAPKGDAAAWPGSIDAAALDACLHPIATLIAQADPEASGVAWLPIAVDRLRVVGTQPSKMIAHATQVDALQTSIMQSFDVTITDEAGSVWATVEGLWLQRLSGAQQARPVPLSTLRWRLAAPAPVELPAAADAASERTPWHCALLGQGAEQLARDIEAATADATAALDLQFTDSFDKLPVDPPQTRSILLLGNGTTADNDAGRLDQCLRLLALAQSLGARPDVGRMIVVTRGAFQVAAADQTANPAEAAVWGFCRTLQWERSPWNLTLVDLPAVPGALDLAELVHIVQGAVADRQIAVRGGARHVPKLATEMREAAATSDVKLPAEFRLEAVGNTGPQSVRPVPAAIPDPQTGQVRIRPRAMGLNFRDLMKSLGIYPGSIGAAFWLGDECAGVVDAVGPGVKGLAPGDEVIAVAPAAFGSRTVTDARLVVAKPPGLTFEEAATIPIVFTTAWHCLVDVARLAQGETVLIHAGAGGVGLAAIQIAQKIGARVVASAGTAEKRAYLRNLGVRHVIDSSTPDFAPELIREIGTGGVDVVLNSLAGPYVEASLEVLAAGGRFVEIGKRDFLENTRIGLRPFHKGLRYAAVDMERFYVADRNAGRRLLETVVAEFNSGRLRPIPGTVYPVHEAPRAFQKLLRREVIGKVVLTNPTITENEVQGALARRNTYLITGGLGALGLVAAKWLTQRGAARIVLAGRSAPSADVADRIDLLCAKGSLVEAVRLDAADRGQLSHWFAAFDRSGDRLAGVIHAAGVLDDATLMTLDPGHLEKVFRPKATAAWLLHEFTRDRDLDLFMCFSSISGVLGSPGQANYAAANAYLDGLCAMRRAAGLAGQSINWGPWDVGMAGSGKTRSRFEQIGLRGIGAEAGIAALEQASGLAESNVFGCDADWQRFRAAARNLVGLEILSEIAPETVADATATSTDATLVDRANIFALLRRNIFEVTSVPEADLNEATAFRDIGFDSIVGLELILRLESLLGVMPDAQMLSEDTTLGEVTNLLVDALVKSGKRKGAAAQPSGAASKPAVTTKEATPSKVSLASETLKSPEHKPAGARANGADAGMLSAANDLATPPTSGKSPVRTASVAITPHGADHNASADHGLDDIRRSLVARDYTDVVRPDFGAALREMRLDVDYTHAQGDLLTGSRDGVTIDAIDMLGGFGSTLFGHNHPALVGVLVQALTEQRPQFVQLSNRTSAGTLARELSERLGQLTGRDYNVILGSTGAEMVDAAIKHTLFEWADRRDKHNAARSKDANPAPPVKPVLFAIEGSYHGKTLGAYALTYRAPGRDAIGLSGPFDVVWLPRDDEVAAAKIFASYAAQDDAAGSTGFNRIAGVFVEPILGEGGIYPLSSGYARALRRLADVAGCPIIVDEIQCGMGRCGAFTAASVIGVAGDYYLFGKSLGGGLTKTCALMIDKRRYRAGYGFAHTSTFGEDDHGAIVALRALRLLDEDDIPKRAADAGLYFLAALAKLRSTFPDVLADVRGCGLMLGAELADQSQNASPLISGLDRQRLLALIVASHMLHRSGIRVGTALSQPTTLRFEPSAYVTTEQIDATVEALGSVCRIIRAADAAEFLRHFANGGRLQGPSAFSIRAHARAGEAAVDLTRQSDRGRRAVFLAHMIDSNDIALIDPSLKKLSPSERECLAERISEPLPLKSIQLTAATGEQVEFDIQVLPLTASSIIQSVRTGETSRIVSLVDAAIAQFAAEGTSVVGLGGLLSVVTRNGTAVEKNAGNVVVTTGNTYTVALARAAILKSVGERGLDRGKIRIGIIGAGGNIGSALTQLLADNFSRFRLVGRKETMVRVERTAEATYDVALARLKTGEPMPEQSLAAALARTSAGRASCGADARRILQAEFGEDPFLPLCTEIVALDDCIMIVSASNSILPILNARNVGKGVRIICDVSVPSDVDPELIKARPDIEVIRGGIALAPAGNDFELDFVKLPHNCLLACMAETAVLGLAGRRAFPSTGDIDPGSVRLCQVLAEGFGFHLGFAAAEKSFAIELE